MLNNNELSARIFLHKVAIVGGVLMRNYQIAHSTDKGVQLPPHIIDEEADEYSNSVIQKALANGNFEELYERVWANIQDVIPENLKLV